MPDQSGKTPDGGAGDLAPGLMTEYLTDAWGFFIRSARQYEKFRSPHQAVEVHDTAHARLLAS